MISEALLRRLLKAVAVNVGAPDSPSLTVSKKRSMLNEATVNSLAVGVGTAVGPAFVGGLSVVSGSMVHVRNAYSNSPTTLVKTVPTETFTAVVPGCASLSTRNRSGFSSKRGTFAGDPGGSGSEMLTPGSRNGRGTPVTTP